jgi:hypothetical protein
MTQSTTTRKPRQRKPRQKPMRFARIVNDAETLVCTLVIRTVEQPSGRETVDTYTVEDIGTDRQGARGISLTNPDGTVYNLELDGGYRSCDCKGHERHGHCKHADAVAKLIELGRL